MLQQFTTAFDPMLWCESGRSIQGEIPLKDLDRLQPMLSEDSGNVEFELTFSIGNKKKGEIKGNLTARPILECQVCLEPFEFEIDREIILQPVTGELEAEQLPDEIDPLLIEEHDEISVLRLIEDELLLALPLVPQHRHQCKSDQDLASVLDEASAKDEENPFAVLQQLKDR